MAIHYEFGLRFRAEHESEGTGSILFQFEAVETYVNAVVRRLIQEIKRNYPRTAFDGMVLYRSREVS